MARPKRRFLRSKDSKILLRRFSSEYRLPETFFGRKPKVESLSLPGGKELFLVEGRSLILAVGDRLYPTLTFHEALRSLPKVVVDMGAVPHVCNGADVMAPGVRKIEGAFKEGSVVSVVDERHRKFLAVGVAEVGSEAIERLGKGKCVKNVHYVGDKVWKELER
ncbi:TPA: RNA-binding protein [Candidatus Bathyarchaeota archaeon]|nr:RNA-binding protein [Candidatus Bathyarchaeota archaeon]